MSEQLWDRHAIAEYLGIEERSVDKWLSRNPVPVAAHGPRARTRGAGLNLYRASDIRTTAAALPGKGNRTPRKKENA